MEWKEIIRGATKDQDIPILVTKRWVCAEEAENRIDELEAQVADLGVLSSDISELETLLTRAYDWMQPMPCSHSCQSIQKQGNDCDGDRESMCDDIYAAGCLGGARAGAGWSMRGGCVRRRAWRGCRRAAAACRRAPAG